MTSCVSPVAGFWKMNRVIFSPNGMTCAVIGRRGCERMIGLKGSMCDIAAV